MFELLQNHPFAVEAFFDFSLVLTFAAPAEQLAHLLPPCLSLDTFNDRWAFVAAAMVQTKGLRPKGLPAFMGNDFFLIGYRVFVRYHANNGKRLRGLYILKSQTNKKKMEVMGNIFTQYRYTTTDIDANVQDNRIAVVSKQSDLDVLIERGDSAAIALPSASPFASWKEARRFAGPLPFTFTYHPEKQRVLIIEGVRQDWEPEPVRVLRRQVGFINTLHADLQLANAFVVRNIPYYWKKGRQELWQP